MVKTVTDRETGKQFACKIMSLPPPGRTVGDNESTRADIFKEIDILIALKHPNIVNMKGEAPQGRGCQRCVALRCSARSLRCTGPRRLHAHLQHTWCMLIGRIWPSGARRVL